MLYFEMTLRHFKVISKKKADLSIPFYVVSRGLAHEKSRSLLKALFCLNMRKDLNFCLPFCRLLLKQLFELWNGRF